MNKSKLISLIVVASSASAIAFFSYKWYKLYKETKEGALYGEELDEVIEARKLMEQMKEKVIDYDEEEEEVYQDYTESFDEEPQVEEEEEMRHDPRSQEAMDQYINMRLAEFKDAVSDKIYKQMVDLFSIPVTFGNEMDQTILDQLKVEREEFFGGTVPEITNNVSFAELILYLSEQLDYQIDGGVVGWSLDLLGNLDIQTHSASRYRQIAVALRDQAFSSKHGYGIFALNDSEYRRLLEIAGSGPITFMQQLNIFVERILEEEVEEYDE